MNKNEYNKSLIMQTKNKKTTLCCYICGENDPLVIEMHHIDGRSNSDDVIPLCKNCHFKITKEQNGFSTKHRSSKASSIEHNAFQLVTNGALLKLIGEKQISLGYELAYNYSNATEVVFNE